MRRLFVWLVLAASLASALSTTAEFSTTLSTVDQLVAVDANLDFPVLLPGAAYSTNVTVRWALPDDALRDLDSDWVRVHVVAYTPEPSWIVLQSGGQTYRVYAFVLQCRVQQGRCALGSNLAHSFQAVLRVPANASSGHSERLIVQASLSEDYPSIVMTSDASFPQRVQDFFDQLLFKQASAALGGWVQPTPAASSLPSSSKAVVVTVSADTVGDSSSASRDAALFGLPAQVAAQPTDMPPGKQNISPINGLVITRDDAVFYGGTVVLILLAILFAKRFLIQQRSNGLLDA